MFVSSQVHSSSPITSPALFSSKSNDGDMLITLKVKLIVTLKCVCNVLNVLAFIMNFICPLFLFFYCSVSLNVVLYIIYLYKKYTHSKNSQKGLMVHKTTDSGHSKKKSTYPKN